MLHGNRGRIRSRAPSGLNIATVVATLIPAAQPFFAMLKTASPLEEMGDEVGDEVVDDVEDEVDVAGGDMTVTASFVLRSSLFI